MLQQAIDTQVNVDLPGPMSGLVAVQRGAIAGPVGNYAASSWLARARR